MARSYTFTATNVAKAAIVIQGPCTRVTIREDPSVVGWPTQGYQLYAPTTSNLPVTYNPGEWIDLPVEARWVPGQTIGYIQTLVGSTTMAQRED